MEQVHNEQAAPWRLDSYLDLAFDGLTGSEYWMSVSCAYNTQTEEKLTLAELIPNLNSLERHIALSTDWQQSLTCCCLTSCASWLPCAPLKDGVRLTPPMR